MDYTDSTAAASGGAIVIFVWCIICVIGLVYLAGTIFWILMLVDAIKREWKDRQTWILILAISFLFSLHWVAAIVYYFTVKKANLGTVKE